MRLCVAALLAACCAAAIAGPLGCNAPDGIYALDVASPSKLRCIDTATGATSDILDLGLDADFLVQAWDGNVFLAAASSHATSFEPVIVSESNSSVTELGSHPVILGYTWQIVAGSNIDEVYVVGCSPSSLVVYSWPSFDAGQTTKLLGTLALSSTGPSCSIVPLAATMSAATNELFVVLDAFEDSYRVQRGFVITFSLSTSEWGSWVEIASPVEETFVGLFFDPYRQQLLTFDQQDNLWQIDPSSGAVTQLSHFAVPNDFLSGALFFPPDGAGPRVFYALTSNFGPSTSSSGSGSAIEALAARGGSDAALPKATARRHKGRVNKNPVFVVDLVAFDLDTGVLLSSATANVSRFSLIAPSNSFVPPMAFSPRP